MFIIIVDISSKEISADSYTNNGCSSVKVNNISTSLTFILCALKSYLDRRCRMVNTINTWTACGLLHKQCVWRKMSINLSTPPSGCHRQSSVLWNFVLLCNVGRYVRNLYSFGTLNCTVIWIYEYIDKHLFNFCKYVVSKLLCKQLANIVLNIFIAS